MKNTPPVILPLDAGLAVFEVFEREGNSGSEVAAAIYFCQRDSLARDRVPVRIHSACLPSEAFRARDCDCDSQLQKALFWARDHMGIVIYLFQEGRGAGLYSKFKGLALTQAKGLNTYDAYGDIGVPPDLREYSFAAEILKEFGVKSVTLLTNNPEKIKKAKESGFRVAEIQRIIGTLEPANFTYLYTKAVRGGHEIRDLLPGRNLNYFSFWDTQPDPKKATIIFDADDTLWEDSLYYEEFMRELSNSCPANIDQTLDRRIRDIIDQAETEGIDKYGYGPIGFKESMLIAHARICREFGNFNPPDDFFNRIIQKLTSVPFQLIDGVVESIDLLRKSGYEVCLYTKGLPDIQARKLWNSRIAHLFDGVGFVRDKTKDNLQRFVYECANHLKCSPAIVVGNSIKSDIKPALEIGISAILFENPNTWHMDRSDEISLERVAKISEYKDLCRLVDELFSACDDYS